VTLKNFNGQDFDLFPAFFHPDVAGTYVFQLTVSDGCLTRTAQTTVTAQCNAQPVARISAPQNVTINGEHITVVALDGSASSDADGELLTYSWALTNGSAILFNSASSIASLQLYNPGTFRVTLTVSDGCQNSATVEYIIFATMQCTQVATAQAVLNVPYSYVPQITETVVLFGDDGNFAPGNTMAMTTRSTNPLIDASGIQHYRGYDSYYSNLERFATQLQCDTLYTWTLVSFSEATSVTSSNPCTDQNVAFTSLCSDVATAANTSGDSSSTPVEKRGYFIAIMVIIAAIIVVIGLFLYFRCCRRPGPPAAKMSSDHAVDMS